MGPGNLLRLETGAASEAGTVTGWNRVALQALRSTQPAPAVASRALAVLHTAMYNAWAAYDDAARQTRHGAAVRLPRIERSAASKMSAMSFAAYGVLAGCFPARRALFDARMTGLGLDPATPGSPFSPAGIGRIQAAGMLAFCRRDGAGAAAVTLTPGQAPGRWCLAAQRLSARSRHQDDQDVRLFFALANALADAAVAGWDSRTGECETRTPVAIRGNAGAAASEVFLRFSGGAGTRPGAPGDRLGRRVGARAYEEARRHWEGNL